MVCDNMSSQSAMFNICVGVNSLICPDWVHKKSRKGWETYETETIATVYAETWWVGILFWKIVNKLVRQNKTTKLQNGAD